MIPFSQSIPSANASPLAVSTSFSAFSKSSIRAVARRSTAALKSGPSRSSNSRRISATTKKAVTASDAVSLNSLFLRAGCDSRTIAEGGAAHILGVNICRRAPGGLPA